LSETVEYVYCVLSGSSAAGDAPRGIDGVPVRQVAHDGVVALVSSLDASSYSGDTVSGRMDDPEWLTPRAVRHDAIVTWAGDRGPVVPIPMWVMFSNESAVVDMLAERGAEFRATLERVTGAREFGVRLSGDPASLAAASEKMDSALALLEQQASTAPPGQAYLLRRKLADARKAATRDAAVRIVDQTHDALSNLSRASLARATALANEPGVLLDGAYLVADDQYESFRSVLTGIIAVYEPAGLHFDFTGPWPPYHFVRDN
jgi:gas vesicle protein GvpL/GvpF